MKLLVKVFIMVHHHGLDYIFVFLKENQVFLRKYNVYIYFFTFKIIDRTISIAIII